MVSKMTWVCAILGFFAVGCAFAQRKLPLGVFDFADIIARNFTYTDKSGFIKAVMTDESRLILITRPRLFGKATALSMLRYFLENRIHSDTAWKIGFNDLFQGLSISEDTAFCRAHRGQYPTILLSFENVFAVNYEAAKTAIAISVGEVYRNHEYLLDDDILTGEERRTFELVRDKTAPLAYVTASIGALCQYLHRKNNKSVILLISAFEKPFQAAFHNKYTDPMRSLMHDLLLPALKNNPYLLKAVITGVSIIGQEALLAELPEVRLHSVLNDQRYTEFFGFLESDVRALAAETGLTAKRELLDTWYRGYDISGTLLYNPFSVLSFLSQGGKPGFYWVRHSLTEFVVKLIFAMSSPMRMDFDNLMFNKSLDKMVYNEMPYQKLVSQEEPFWTLLVHNGYLVAKPKGPPGLYAVRMPNKEIRDELFDMCKKKIEGKMDTNNPNVSYARYTPSYAK
nr:PREDICTED: uncharacterized protein LOC109044417 [Bemisia tabaci]